MSERSLVEDPAVQNASLVHRALAIKCDRNSPCSGCVASRVPCRRTPNPREKKQRVLLSTRYDESLTEVNRKLEDISTALKNLHQPQAGRLGLTSAFQSTSAIAGDDTSNGEHESDVHYEGGSSFVAHSKEIANRLNISLTVPSSEHTGSVTPEADRSLLRTLLNDATATNSPNTPTLSSQSLSQCPELLRLSVPSHDNVLKLLRAVGTTAHRWIVEYQVMNFQDFTYQCQKVYFPTEDYSIYSWTVVQAGLFCLFRNCDSALSRQLGLDAAETQSSSELCATNVEAAIRQFCLAMSPSVEASQALIAAANISMDKGKVSTAWRLTTTAARMCLDLGLHHLPSRHLDRDTRQKRLLFWQVYALERALALNLGRTPTILDYDITTDRPSIPADIDASWGRFYILGLDLAMLEGHIYEQLFSASAQQQEIRIRMLRAQALATRAREIKDELDKLDIPTDPSMVEFVRYVSLSHRIVIYCLLAVILRIVPSSQESDNPLLFSDDCVAAARIALQTLWDAWHSFEDEDFHLRSIFLNATLLSIPFIPFIIIFGNTVALANHDDLNLLRNVVAIMKEGSERCGATERLHTACSRFANIASLCLAMNTAGDQTALVQGRGPTDEFSASTTEQATGHISQMDVPMSQQEWDNMLSEFEVGLPMEDAREMSSYFEPYLTSNWGLPVRPPIIIGEGNVENWQTQD